MLRFLDIHDPALADAADANLAFHAGWVQRHTAGMRVIEDEQLVVVDGGSPCDTFNLVCRARLLDASAGERIREVIDYFRDVGRPFSWWRGPGTTPADLDARLVAAGLAEAETETAMVATLEQVQWVEPKHPRLHIRRVRGAEQLHDFAHTIGMRETAPDPDVLRFYEQAASVLLDADTPLWLYVGYVDDAPVATAELTVGGGVVGLYNISTLPAHRRRGIGTAMTLHPLRDALKQGHRTAILQASTDGARLYPRLGFETFGTITEFKPPHL
jgi:ribosomal protein S18 acetylase RimI-like enzyme